MGRRECAGAGLPADHALWIGDRTESGGAGAARPSGSTGIVIPGPDLDHGRQCLHLATRSKVGGWRQQDAVGVRRPDHGESRAVGHSPSMLTIAQANGAADMLLARHLFEEYADSLDVDLCFQDFASEL